MRPTRVLMIILEVVLIFVASSAVINYVVTKPVSGRDATEIKFSAANAKKSAGQLNDDQYAALKNSRQQIATFYESSGRAADAEAVYKTMQTSGLQEGYVLSRAHVPAQALPRLQDAQEFSAHLTEGKQAALMESSGAVVECLRETQRYDDAVENSRQMIDYLRASSNPSDLALTDKYLELAQTFSEAKQWEQSEQTLMLGWSTVDQVTARRSSLPHSDPAYIQALTEKDLLLHWLVSA